MTKRLVGVILLAVGFAHVAGAEDIMTITSSAFSHGEAIPAEFTCKGSDVTPPLEWSGVPEGAVALALICDDPDAPVGTWDHWVYFDIPVGLSGLPSGVEKVENPDTGGTQGSNSWRRSGYGGPCPPSGTHRYFFRLYALDTTLDLKASANKRRVLRAMEKHVLAEAELMGTFSK